MRYGVDRPAGRGSKQKVSGITGFKIIMRLAPVEPEWRYSVEHGSGNAIWMRQDSLDHSDLWRVGGDAEQDPWSRRERHAVTILQHLAARALDRITPARHAAGQAKSR